MAIELTIRDGDPWYMSPDIWVIPGFDPNGSPGIPRAGEPNFVWVRVTNTGSTGVENATVKYYWANPSTAITPLTANLIGLSYVQLAPGETREVLCLTPWQPIWVNDGHECLIVEAFAIGDPVMHGPEEPFNPPGDRHVAQLNVNVIEFDAAGMMTFPFFAFNPDQRNKGKFRLSLRQVHLKILEPTFHTLGLKSLPKDELKIKEFGLNRYRCGDQVREIGRQEMPLELAPGQHQGMGAIFKTPLKIPPSAGALFLVEQYMDDYLMGGIALLLIASKEGGKRDV